VVRTSAEPSSVVSAIRQAVWSVDKNQPTWRVQTLHSILDSELSAAAQSTTLMTAFALLALLLASLGLYGVLSYAITRLEQFTRDIHFELRQVRRNPSFSVNRGPAARIGL
jgi:uncharacterized BrkB/YihY/UPF0761 family membrane protein